MKKILGTLVVCLGMGILLAGCPGPKSEYAPPASATGTIEGYLYIQQFNDRAAGATQQQTTIPIPPAPPEGHKAIQGAFVRATGCLSTTTTDATGHFILSGVNVGPQTVTITKDGYGVTTINMNVSESQITSAPKVVMSPAVGGSLTVNSTPINADIYIDNIFTGQKTPYTFNPMKVGTHTVYLTIKNYDTPDSQNVLIGQNAMSELKFLLVESKAIFLLISIRSDSSLNIRNVWAGTTEQFVADCFFSDGHKESCTSEATWTSSDETIGTIGLHSGLFYGKKAGYTSVTVSLNGNSANANVSVQQSQLETITVTPGTLSIAAGHKQQFTARCTQTDGTSSYCTSNVAWTSTDTGKGAIDPVGLFSAMTEGMTEVFASWQGKVSNNAIVTVGPPTLTSISVTPVSASVAAGLTQQFYANCSFSDSTTAGCTNNVNWSSSNAAVGSIGVNSGLFTGLTVGSSSITASWQGKNSNLPTAQVTAPVLKTITIVPPSASVFAHYTQQFSANCVYTDNSVQDCTGSVFWQSEVPAKGTIDSTSGLFTGVSGGTTYVKCTHNELGTVSSRITVVVKDTATVKGFVYIAGTAVPIAGARVSVAIGSIGLFDFTDNVGYYEILYVPTGSLSINTTKTGYDDFAGTLPNVVAPETASDIYMTPQLGLVTLSGTIKNSATQLPIEGVTVTLLYSDLTPAGNSASTDVDGKYSISGIPGSPAITYKVSLQGNGYTSKTVDIGTMITDKTQNVTMDPAP